LVNEDSTAFPTLGDAELAVLDGLGTRRPLIQGEHLYREGDATYDFFVIVSGLVDIVLHSDGGERVIASHGPGRFLGELNMLSGQRVLLSARVAEAGEVIVVPAAALRHLVANGQGLGDKILAAFMARRAVLLEGAASAVRIIGSRFSPDSMQVREFLTRSRIPHEWLDPDRDAAVEGVLQSAGLTPADLPVVIVSGAVLRAPTPGSLAEYLGLTVGNLPDRCFDLVIVGGGPAGLAAAVYGASEGLRTLGVEMVAVGGQAGTSSRIENYLGFPTGISGGDLAQRAVVQAEKFGAYLTSPCAATSLREEAGHLVVHLSDGTEVAGRAVIVASGARYRRLGVERLEDFERNGVYYAATESEARDCSGAPIVVAGGGNSAGQAAIFLAGSGSTVTVIIRGGDLNASMSRYLVDRIEGHPRISVRTNTTITALHGHETLTAIAVSDPTGAATLPCSGLFSFIGADPSSSWLCGCAALDEDGFVLTDRALRPEDLGERWETIGRRPLPFETSHPGLFAVGDVRSGSTKRVAAAVGEGSAAVRAVHEFLAFTH
jgi:thioredoxin reductase (NADPH)